MKTITLLLSLAFVGCATTPCSLDTTKPCPAPATCETACANGERLGCIWATPTPMGAPCLDVCRNAGLTVPWNVDALAAANTCQ